MSTATDSSKFEFTAVIFFWGTPVLYGVAFCTNSRPVTVGLVTYEPFPRMEVEIAPNSEGLVDDTSKISFDLTKIDQLSAQARSFLGWMDSEDPIHRTYVSIANIQVSEAGVPTIYNLTKGEISRRERNSSPGMLTLEVSNPKNISDVSSGFRIAPTCNNSFGDERCKKNLNSLRQVGVLSYLGDFTVQITGLSTAPWPLYWLQGYVEQNGLYLPIVDWNSAVPDVFVLARKPPEAWEGTNVRVMPGCLKDLDACKRWNNVQNMVALGYSLRSKHPVFETT